MKPVNRRWFLALVAAAVCTAVAVQSLRAAPFEPDAVKPAPTGAGADGGRFGINAAATVTITAPDSITVGNVAGLVHVEVVDIAGEPVADGMTVTLGVDKGEIAPRIGTTRAGFMTATLTSSLTAGLAELTAQVGEVSARRSVAYIAGPPAALRLTAAVTAYAGVPLPVSVIATDAYGNRTGDGSPVAWEAELGQAEPATSTILSGVAATSIHNVTAGSEHITATLTQSSLEASAIVSYLPGPTASLLLEVSPRRIAVGGRADVTLTAADAFGNLAADNLSVLLTASGGQVSPGIVRLNQGVGRTELRAGGIPGEYQVAATAAGIVGTASVSVRPADLALEIGVRGPRGALPEHQVHPGEPVWLDLMVVNSDLATARDVVIGVMVPDAMRPGRATSNGSIHERSSGPPGLIDTPPDGHRAIFWDVADVPYGQRVTVTVPGSIDRALPWTGVDTFYVRAAANSKTVEASGSDLARGRAIEVHSADLYLTTEMDLGASQLHPGGTAVLEIRFGNHYRMTQLGRILITDTLPAGLVYDHWQPGLATNGLSTRGTFDENSRVLSWNLEPDFGAAGTLRLWLRIEDSVLPDAAITNRVAIGSDVHDVTPANNADSAAFALRGVNLVTTIESPVEAVAGDDIAYHVVVRNQSQRDPASAVKVTVRPPAGARVVSRSAGGVTDANGAITWESSSVGAGGRLEYDVVVAVPEATPLGGLVQAMAAALSHEPDSLPADNEDQAVTVIVAGPPGLLEMAPPGPATACTEMAIPVALNVKDRRGNPVRDGTSVSWSATSGSVVDPTTTSGGQATASWWPGREAGAALLAAMAGEARVEQAVEVRPSTLAALALSVRPRIVAAGGQVQVTVNALNGCSRAAADGVPVVLTADRGAFAGAGSSMTMTTRGGRVVATLHVGENLGPLRVKAEHDAVLSESIVSVVPPGDEPPPEEGPPVVYLPFVMGRTRR